MQEENSQKKLQPHSSHWETEERDKFSSQETINYVVQQLCNVPHCMLQRKEVSPSTPSLDISTFISAAGGGDPRVSYCSPEPPPTLLQPKPTHRLQTITLYRRSLNVHSECL